MLNIKAIIDKEGLSALKKEPDLFMRRLKEAFGGWLKLARLKSQRDYFSGRPHLISRSGKLKKSEFTAVKAAGAKLTGIFGAKSIYARIHEFGGIIRPKKAQALHFFVDGKEVFTKKVTIPARPFLKPALMDAVKVFESFMKAKMEKPR